jgi:hypothetical protein
MNTKIKSSLSLIVAGFISVLPLAAFAQSDVRAEGKISYKFNPVSGQTTIDFQRLANYTTSDQKIHIGLMLSPKKYDGKGGFSPNFSKFIGTLPARTYTNPISVTGTGSFPKQGTFFITVAIGIVNASNKIVVANFYQGQKHTFGEKPSNNTKNPGKNGGKKTKRASTPFRSGVTSSEGTASAALFSH